MVLADKSHEKPKYLKIEEKGLVLESFQGQPDCEARAKISVREYKKEGGKALKELRYLKKMKSSTQFFEGPRPLYLRIVENVSAILLNTPPKGALWSM